LVIAGYTSGMRRLLGLLVVAVLLSACGSGSNHDKQSATTWANGVCSAVGAWRGSLSSTVGSLETGAFSGASVKSAVSRVDGATRRLGRSLRRLGAPDTPSGQQAKRQVDALAVRLEGEVGRIVAAVRKTSGAVGVLDAVTVGAGTLGRMRTQVTNTLGRLRRLDGGPLASGFLDASSCSHLLGTT
jgi:hypothetical protein